MPPTGLSLDWWFHTPSDDRAEANPGQGVPQGQPEGHEYSPTLPPASGGIAMPPPEQPDARVDG
eukprot:8089403-Prorocentrum_lima.AAC.1